MTERRERTAALQLRHARETAGLTQREFARRAGVTQTTVSMYETGQRDPSVSTFERMLAVTGSRLEVISPTSPVRAFPQTRRGRLLRRRARALERLGAARGITNVRVFGSTARGDDGPESDIDLVVDIEHGVGMLALVGFQREVSELLDEVVDVVPYRGLKEYVRVGVDAEAIPL
jgi:predicted nucleotidyltransferase/DNA-binding XRE family transcriptional regulator